MTKKEYFAVLKGIVSASGHAEVEGINEFIDHEVELLDRKRTSGKQTKTQKENVGVMETIRVVLAESDAPMTISAMLKDERLADYSNQKLSALLRQMGANGIVNRTEDKKKAYFSIA